MKKTTLITAALWVAFLLAPLFFVVPMVEQTFAEHGCPPRIICNVAPIFFAAAIVSASVGLIMLRFTEPERK